MARGGPGAAVFVERFFQLSIWGLVASGYLAVAAAGALDLPTLAFTGAALLLRLLLITGAVRLHIPERLVVAATVAYAGFFPLDYLFFSQNFLATTVHLLFFLASVKVLSARSQRDYFYLAMIAFLELLAASILSFSPSFFLYLALFLLCAMAAFTSGEIRRSLERAGTVARSAPRRFYGRLTALTAAITAGILGLTAGLFFLLPRTAEAAFQQLSGHRIYLPGFSNQVTLGEIGEIKTNSAAVMHVRFYSRAVPPGLKWRGNALAQFDGRKWFNRPGRDEVVPVDGGQVTLAIEGPLAANRPHLNYRVELNNVETDALFFAGEPVRVDLRQSLLMRTAGGAYRLGRMPSQGFAYEAYSALEPDIAPLDERGRRRYLQLPPLDPRIPALARQMTAGAPSDERRARELEQRLRHDYGYSLQMPAQEPRDPLAWFLFERRKGYCEYFASAMTVMLRTLGIPARMVTGFQSGTWNPLTGMYVVRASDAHSWVEAWLPGRGWTTFDPTPADTATALSTLGVRLALYLDAAETFWRDWVLSYDPGRQARLADRVERGGRNFGLRLPERMAALRRLWDTRLAPWGARYGAWLLALAAWCAALGFAARPLERVWRMRRGVRRLRRGTASMADATLLYRRMLELLEKRGFEKPAWYTPREFARTLPDSEWAALAGEFTAAYNAVRFGGRQEAAPKLSLLLEKLERQGS